MSHSRASWGHIACWQSCRWPHDVFNLEITTFSGNDLCNVTQSEVDLHKKKVITSPESPHHRPSSGNVDQKSSSVARSGVDFQIKKFVYLSSAACVEGFKRVFEDETLQYCQKLLRILEFLERLRGSRI